MLSADVLIVLSLELDQVRSGHCASAQATVAIRQKERCLLLEIGAGGKPARDLGEFLQLTIKKLVISSACGHQAKKEIAG